MATRERQTWWDGQPNEELEWRFEVIAFHFFSASIFDFSLWTFIFAAPSQICQWRQGG